MKLVDLQSDLHDEVLKSRKLEYISRTPEFVAAYEKSDVDARSEVLKLLRAKDSTGVERWIGRTLKSAGQVEELPVVELRILAVRLGVLNNRTMSKAALIAAIIKQREYLNAIGSTPPPENEVSDNRVGDQRKEV